MEKEIKKSSLKVSENGLEKPVSSKRLEVLKTYKIYIGGQFPRTESGRYYIPTNAAGKKLANVCLSSRKDFRDAVVAARGAVSGWSGLQTRHATPDSTPSLALRPIATNSPPF